MIVEAYGEPEPVAAGPSAAERLCAYLAAEERYVRGGAVWVLAGLIADSQRRPDLAKTMEDVYFAKRHQAIGFLLTEAIAQGDVREDVELDVVIALLLDPLYQSLLTGRSTLQPPSAISLVHHLMQGIGLHDR